MNNYTFHVTGTHCPACKILIEDVVKEQEGIHSVSVDLGKEIVSIESESTDAVELASELSKKLHAHGYSLSLERMQKLASDSNELLKAIPIGLAFLALFILVQKSGIVNLGVGGTVTPVTSFLIGLVASVSSCLAVVGGLVLSLSATVSLDDQDDKKPIMLFHGGRLFGFAVLGGVLGLLGQAIGISYTVSAALGLLAAVVMILLGLNLLGIFKQGTLTLPSNVFSFFRKVEHKTWAPLILGIGTFFLPCGFTQSMQIAALSSGSWIMGSLIMFSFALGTLPMLSLLSFGAASFSRSKHAPLFFKTAGVVVIGLGLLGFVAGLAGMGIIQPLFNL
jgi:sulfite exporter TauE/SafE/copper chaperone CopZ